MSSVRSVETGSFGTPIARRRGRFGWLGLAGVVVVVYLVIALLNPWALHIGGRWTPFLTWTGTGRLVTSGGNYPLFITLSPSRHGSRLRLNGLRPISGVDGRGWLCTPRGTIPLRLSGTIYGRWRSTDGALMEFRLLEWNTVRQQIIGTSARRGYFDLFGYWHGPKLVMDDRGEWSAPFRSGLKIGHASVNLTWGTKSDFEKACAVVSASR
jgi:hypothetical protein